MRHFVRSPSRPMAWLAFDGPLRYSHLSMMRDDPNPEAVLARVQEFLNALAMMNWIDSAGPMRLCGRLKLAALEDMSSSELREHWQRYRQSKCTADSQSG